MKKLLVSVSILAILGLSFGAVSARYREQRYSSYVEMPGGSYLEGSSRDYIYENHKISLKPTNLVPAMSPYVRVDVGLDRKSWFSWKRVSDNKTYFNVTGRTYSLNMGNHKKGKFRYTFYTGNASTFYGGFTADPVYMYSYAD